MLWVHARHNSHFKSWTTNASFQKIASSTADMICQTKRRFSVHRFNSKVQHNFHKSSAYLELPFEMTLGAGQESAWVFSNDAHFTVLVWGSLFGHICPYQDNFTPEIGRFHPLDMHWATIPWHEVWERKVNVRVNSRGAKLNSFLPPFVQKEWAVCCSHQHFMNVKNDSVEL